MQSAELEEQLQDHSQHMRQKYFATCTATAKELRGKLKTSAEQLCEAAQLVWEIAIRDECMICSQGCYGGDFHFRHFLIFPSQCVEANREKEELQSHGARWSHIK